MLDPALLDDAAASARRHAESAATAGVMHPEVLDACRRAGLFTLFLPSALGGEGLDVPAGCAAIARMAAADAAAGWAVMIASGANWFAGHMPEPLADEVFGGADAVVAGSGIPGGAVRVPGGIRVDGCWRWCSGAPWATWFTFNVRVDDEPELTTIAVPASDVSWDPSSWDVTALRATATLTVTLNGVSVPATRCFTVRDGRPLRSEPIFATPFVPFAQATMAAVMAGTASRALDECLDLTADKSGPGGGVDPVIADRVARMTASIRAASAYLDRTAERLWAGVVSGEVDPATVTDVQLSAAHLTSAANSAATAMWELAGMSVLPAGSMLRRVLADLGTVGQNALVSPARFADAGAALTGR